MVRIPGFHPGDPGSSPGIGTITYFWLLSLNSRGYSKGERNRSHPCRRISGLVVEYIVAIDVTRVRFPADAFVVFLRSSNAKKASFSLSEMSKKVRKSVDAPGILRFDLWIW